MDAQTHHAAIPATRQDESLTVSPVLFQHLSTLFSGLSLDQLEQECRMLIQTTANAIIQLGMRLTFLKHSVKHGDWTSLLARIGIEKSVAARTMAAAIRFNALPDGERVIGAAKSKSKLLELLVLNDEELEALSTGKTVRGVSVESLPKLSVARLRSAIRSSTTDFPPTSAPIIGETIDPQNVSSTTHLDAGAGNVSSTRHLGSKLPSTATLPADDPTLYPVAYTLLSGDFDGRPFGIVRHAGHIWLIAEEVAAMIGMTPEATAEMLAMIDGDLVNEFPTDAVAKVRLGSTPTVLRLLNATAIKTLWLTSESPEAEALLQWIEGEESPPSQPATPTPIDSAKPVPTLLELLNQLDGLGNDVQSKWYQVDSQVEAIKRIAFEHDQRSKDVSLLGNLAETAQHLLTEMQAEIDDHDLVKDKLRDRLLFHPGAGELLPESVWLGIIKELSDDRPTWGNEDFYRLAKLAESVRAYAPNDPEAGAAYECLEAFFYRKGRYLGDHARGFGSSWLPGHEPIHGAGVPAR